MKKRFKPLITALAVCAVFVSTNANAMIFNLQGNIDGSGSNTYDIDITVDNANMVTDITGDFSIYAIEDVTTDFLGNNYFNSSTDYSFAFTYTNNIPLTQFNATRLFSETSTSPAKYILGTDGNSNIQNPTTIATLNVTAVPEPETYAMFLAGLGLLGFARRAVKS